MFPLIYSIIKLEYETSDAYSYTELSTLEEYFHPMLLVFIRTFHNKKPCMKCFSIFSKTVNREHGSLSSPLAKQSSLFLIRLLTSFKIQFPLPK